jgi:hypothetical protein
MESEMSFDEFTTDELAGEVWRPIPGFESIYHASSLGRIKSRWTGRGATSRLSVSQWKIMSVPKPNKNGRQTITLHNCIGESAKLYLYQAILLAFVGPCPEGYHGLHRDDNPLNNKIENLRWGTRKENADDARRNGRVADRERHGRSKLTEVQVRDIRQLRLDGWSQSMLAEKFGVGQSHVSRIILGKMWPSE